jgi:hypothetical protein
LPNSVKNSPSPKESFRSRATPRQIRDFPKGPAARQKVQDANRNAQLRDEFHVTGFPIVILSDAHVLGVQRGCGKDGVSGFVSRLAEWRDVGKTLRGILSELDGSSSPEDALQQVQRAAALVERRGLKDFYGTAIDPWSDLARRTGPRLCPAPQALAGVRPDAAQDELPLPPDLTRPAAATQVGVQA